MGTDGRRGALAETGLTETLILGCDELRNRHCSCIMISSIWQQQKEAPNSVCHFSSNTLLAKITIFGRRLPELGRFEFSSRDSLSLCMAEMGSTMQKLKIMARIVPSTQLRYPNVEEGRAGQRACCEAYVLWTEDCRLLVNS